MLRHLIRTTNNTCKVRRQQVSLIGNNIFIRNINNGGIHDFVDTRKNEDGDPIAVGRSWKASELRLKSFEDLGSFEKHVRQSLNMMDNHIDEIIFSKHPEII